ncbi:MAG: alpha-amylase family glycosyl hydrolase [Solidesulfovibrio sp. DCME]|uniref:alpha-amylase family glycosyl hydrolase n=1 Tax=Solidesulfovibrio sp. DCME TaxID=3447380 RepID=UPI003D0FDF88
MSSTAVVTPKAPQPSQRQGMGTMLGNGGAGFRVWAPFAQSVSVVGTFNAWDEAAAPLAHEGNGYWSTDVDKVSVGDAYMFVIRHGDTVLRKKNPYASQVSHSAGVAVVHDPAFDWGGDDFVMPPWNELVIYELHTGTFNDVSPSGPGTLDSIIGKLKEIALLGVNAIELMPVVEFPTDVSWGYNPAQPFAVEQALGGPEALHKLVKAAHALGMAVILDVVYNHFGPDDLDLYRFDGWSNATNEDGIYFYDNPRRNTPWGPRPDYGRAEVRQFIRDNALFWLHKYHIDGLRLDSVCTIRNCCGNDNDPANDLADGWGLLRWINDEVRASQPWKIVIAEDMKQNPWITKDTGQGGAGFGAQWDPGFVHPVRRAVVALRDEDRDMEAVAEALRLRGLTDAMKRVIYTESHDEVANGHSRVPQEICPADPGGWFARKRSTLAAGLVFTAPGIPMLFQGQEMLAPGYFQDNVPLDWSLLHTYSGISTLYRDMIRLRRNWYNETRGLRGHHINVHHSNNTDKCIAFHRFENGGPGDDVVVVANFANRAYPSYTIGFPRPGLWRVRLNTDGYVYSPDFGNSFSYDTTTEDLPQDGMPYRANIGIGPYSLIILSQNNP